MKRIWEALKLVESGDIGLVLIALGLMLIWPALAMIVVGVILLLQARRLREWF